MGLGQDQRWMLNCSQLQAGAWLQACAAGGCCAACCLRVGKTPLFPTCRVRGLQQPEAACSSGSALRHCVAHAACAPPHVNTDSCICTLQLFGRGGGMGGMGGDPFSSFFGGGMGGGMPFGGMPGMHGMGGGMPFGGMPGGMGGEGRGCCHAAMLPAAAMAV
jgi:hypothetical protein